MKDLPRCVAAVCRHRDVQELLIHSNQQEAGEGKKTANMCFPKKITLARTALSLPLGITGARRKSLASVKVLPRAQYYSVQSKYLPVFPPNTLETCCGLGVGNLTLAKESGSQSQRFYQAHGDHSAVDVSPSCKLLLVGELPECAEWFGKSPATCGHCHNRNNP